LVVCFRQTLEYHGLLFLTWLEGYYTNDLLQVSPGDAMEVFILSDQELAIDGCQRERWIV
jgi:hypothetical protein